MSQNPYISSLGPSAVYTHGEPPAWLRPHVPGAEDAWAAYEATLETARGFKAEHAAIRATLGGRHPNDVTTAEREAWVRSKEDLSRRERRNGQASRRALEKYDDLMRSGDLDPAVIRAAAARECLAQHERAAEAAAALTEALNARADAYRWTGQPAGVAPYRDARASRDLGFVTNLLRDVETIIGKFDAAAVQVVAEDAR